MQHRQPTNTSKMVMRLLVLLSTGYALTQFLWGEVILVENGFGWDGVTYRALVLTYPDGLLGGTWFSYYTGRFVPSMLVHVGLDLFQRPFDPANILQGFKLYALVLFILGAVVWGQITQMVGLSVKGTGFAFAALLLSARVAKISFYIPLSTDNLGFFLGIVLLYMFLRRNPWGVLLTTLVGAFTWNIFVYCGLALYVLPCPQVAPQDDRPAPYRLNDILAATLAVLVMLLVVFGKTPDSWVGMFDAMVPPAERWIPLSVAFIGLYVFLGLRVLLNRARLFSLPAYLEEGRVRRLILALVLLVGHRWVISSVGLPNPDWLDTTSLLLSHFVIGRQRPGIGMMSIIIIYGPVILVAAYYWRSVVRRLYDYGLGLTVLMSGVFILSVAPEARLWANMSPFLVLIVSQVVDERDWPPLALWAFVFFAFVFSKIWNQINYPVWGADAPVDSFPSQNLSMITGPAIAPGPYLVHVAVLLFMAVVLWVLFERGEGPRRMPAWANSRLCFAVSLLVVALCFTEVVRTARGTQMPSPQITGEDDFHKRERLAPSDYNVHSAPPLADFSTYVRFNAAGYPAPAPIAAAKDDDTRRVLVLGDVYGLGINTSPDRIHLALLQDQLQTDALDVEVMNASYRAGQTPDTHYAYLVREGLGHAPDAVLLHVNLATLDAMADHIWRQHDRYGGPVHLFHQQPLIGYNGEVVHPTRYWYLRVPVLRQFRPFTGVMAQLTPPPAPQVTTPDDLVTRYGDVLAAFVAQTEAQGVDLYVTVYASGPHDLPTAAFVQQAASTIAPASFLDLTDVIDPGYFQPDYRDFSRDGHMWFADILAQFLRPSLQHWDPNASGPLPAEQTAALQEVTPNLCGALTVNWDRHLLLPTSYPDCNLSQPEQVTVQCIGGDGLWTTNGVETQRSIYGFVEVTAQRNGTCGVFG